MSSTMVVTATASKTTSLFVDPSPTCCPNCGVVIPPHDAEPPSTQLLDAQARIAELETQVFQLNQKATAAVDRWADYEAELTKLRAMLPSSTPEQSHSPSRSSIFQAGATRISALMYSRRPQTASPPAVSRAAPPVTPPPTESRMSMTPMTTTTTRNSGRTAEDLLEALNKEQMLRKAAEGRLNETNRELEDLSATLFEQANEMVATERRARAALEQKLSELEQRDVEKRVRLDKLELAMHRIEKVKTLLIEGYDAEALTLASRDIE
ncbi:hypothetical protein HDV63DRAFT_126354 [Trichoderma sp. SZMC 28014]